MLVYLDIVLNLGPEERRSLEYFHLLAGNSVILGHSILTRQIITYASVSFPDHMIV